MRRTTKQNNFTVLLFIALLLCTSCINALKDDTHPDVARGVVQIVIDGFDDNSARTLFPDIPIFSSYRLSFFPQGAQTAMSDMVLSASDGNVIQNIDIEEGKWEITVYGRIVLGGQEKEVATGSNDAVTVVAGENIIVAVTLHSKDPDGQPGAFAWSITIPAGIAADSYAIALNHWDIATNTEGTAVPLPPSQESTDSETGMVSITGSKGINSGYYLLRANVGTNRQRAYYVEIVHVMTDRTTTFSHQVLSNEFVPAVILSGTAQSLVTFNGSTGYSVVKEVWAYSSADGGEKIGHAMVTGNTWEMAVVEMSPPTDIFFRVVIEPASEIQFEVKSDVVISVSNSDISGITINTAPSLITLSGTVNPHVSGTANKADWKVSAYTDPSNMSGTALFDTPAVTDSGGNWSGIINALNPPTYVYFSIEKDINSKQHKRVNLAETLVYNTAVPPISLTGYFIPPKQVWINGSLPDTKNWAVPKTMIHPGNGSQFVFTQSDPPNSYLSIGFLSYFDISVSASDWADANGLAIQEYNYNDVLPGVGSVIYTDSAGKVQWMNYNNRQLRFTLDFNKDDYLSTGKPDLIIEKRTTEKSNEILIQGGTFSMGSPTGEKGRLGPTGLSGGTSENPHPVTISTDFYMMNSEVSQKLYKELVPDYTVTQDNYPAVNISWLDAVTFANALSVRDGFSPVYLISGTTVVPTWTANGWRLPTEAEWEYAARAGSTTPFAPLGDIGGTTLSSSMANYNASIIDTGTFDYNPSAGLNRGHVIDVRSFYSNAWGLYDMHGNAWEYCWDWFGGEYSTAAVTDPRGPTASYTHATGPNEDQSARDSNNKRIIRGGSYYTPARYLRSAHRGVIAPTVATNNDIGFRLVRRAH
jgi:formylglycine-generating enzyme required for sulfatase activity